MAKKKTFISIAPEVAERIRIFQTQHSISYFSSSVEMLTMMGLEKMDLMAELEESRRQNLEIARYTLAILASISQNSNIPTEVKQAGKASAEQMLTKAIQAAKTQTEENE